MLFLVVDTVRWDHTSFGGYGRLTTPRLEMFARRATVYQRAYASAPWTLPSHASMFTGQFSFQHGVEARLQRDATGAETIVDPPLVDAATTLAELLAAAGYDTAAFTANTAYMDKRYNLQQGFDEYFVKRLPGSEMVDLASAWGTKARKAPFFLFVNLMDAHFPYNTAPCPGAFEGAVPEGEGPVRQLLDNVMPGDKPANPDLVRLVTDQYDRGISNADRAAGELLARLDSDGLLENALVIVVGDHGEFLGEHRFAQHSKDVYEQVLRVPLAIRHPEQHVGHRVERPVSLVQLFRTVLQACRVSESSIPVVAAPGLDSTSPVLAEVYYSRVWDYTNPVWGKRFHHIRTAYYELPWKLIHSSDGLHELYDVVSDPAEARNLFSEESERAAMLLVKLAALKPLQEGPAEPMAGPAPELDDEHLEALRNSGYL